MKLPSAQLASAPTYLHVVTLFEPVSRPKGAGESWGRVQAVGHQVVGHWVAGHQAASLWWLGAGLGSGADTRKLPHPRLPKARNAFLGLSHSPFYPCHPHPPAMRGSPRPTSASGPLGPGPSPPPPPWDSRSMPTGQAPPEPQPAALRSQEVPALSTPGCIGGDSHLPAGVRLRIVNHQLQGLPRGTR